MRYDHSLRPGFSLIELMVTMVIASVLVASLVSLSRSFSASSAASIEDVNLQRGFGNFSAQFVFDVTQAGFVPLDSDLAPAGGEGLAVVFDGPPPPADGFGPIKTVSMRYDISKRHRESVTYEVRPLASLDCPPGRVCPSSSFSKVVYVNRKILECSPPPATSCMERDVFPGGIAQLALGSVESIRCRQILESGQLRGLDCEVRRYTEMNPSSRIRVDQIKAFSG